MSSFTPGPWVVIASGLKGDNYLVCKDVPGRLHPICAMEHGCDAAEANARLIASAPDLLAALERVRDDIDDETMPETVRIIEAALALAEGREVPGEGIEPK